MNKNGAAYGQPRTAPGNTQAIDQTGIWAETFGRDDILKIQARQDSGNRCL